MKPKAYRLLVVAHPDDETIFFSGPLLTMRDLPWHVVCLTDGNADGRGAERHAELLAATKLLGVKHVHHWDFLDLFEKRLPVNEVEDRLRRLTEVLGQPKEVYTHGPMGEYGHPHHQDACLATHRAFGQKMKIHSPAWNCVADFAIQLTPAQYKKKTFAFSQIYQKETSRFLNVLPNMAVESFRRFMSGEVEAVAGYFRHERSLSPKEMKEHSWAVKMMPELREKLETRLF